MTVSLMLELMMQREPDCFSSAFENYRLTVRSKKTVVVHQECLRSHSKAAIESWERMADPRHAKCLTSKALVPAVLTGGYGPSAGKKDGQTCTGQEPSGGRPLSEPVERKCFF